MTFSALVKYSFIHIRAFYGLLRLIKCLCNFNHGLIQNDVCD